MLCKVVKRSLRVALLGGASMVIVPSLAVAQSNQGATALEAGLATTGQAALDFVKKKHSELQVAVKAAKDPKTDTKLLAIFDSMLNYDAISRDSLGNEWDKLTDAQRTEFSSVLQQLVQNSYRKNLRDPADYVVTFVGADESPRGVLVKSTAQSKSNKREKALTINYLVSTTAEGIKVRDVITDDVSLVGNYQSQFKRILKKKGFDGLIEQMRKQLEK